MILDRRHFLAATAVLACSGRALAQTPRIALWPGRPPGGGGPMGPEHSDTRGAVSMIAQPWLEVFAPARPNGAAMLVAAGGGYKRIEMDAEARPAARWLAARGITAFVLAYRLPGEGWADGPLAPLQDAQRALRLIRSDRRLDPARTGVLGFSAGGHLMGLAATRSGFAAYPPVDAADALSVRPDLAALIYPVITLQPPYDHTSTRRALVGDHPDPRQSAQWSVETHVRSGCPPMFLVQAEDDPVSDPANTLIMAQACRAAGIPVDLHRLPTGGHGFGMGHPGPTAAWPGWFETWLHQHGMT
jgi:acetyl esterase/lipase